MPYNPIFSLISNYIFFDDSDIDKHIAQITLQHFSDFEHMTVEKIADLCQVSISTYLRFCKKVGYSSFTEFKIQLTNARRSYNYQNTPFALGPALSVGDFFTQQKHALDQDYQSMMELLDQKACEAAVEALYAYPNIYFVDMFTSSSRFSLHADLAVTGKRVSFIRPEHCVEHLRQEGADEKGLAFLMEDGTARTQSVAGAIRECKKRNCHITVLSYIPHFTNEELCDEILVIGKATSTISSIVTHDLVLRYLSVLFRQKYIQQ